MRPEESDRDEADFDRHAIQRAAQSMIANHGARALDVALRRAANLAGSDSAEARDTWERVVTAIDRLNNPQPAPRTEE
jgi:hypothetical protein